MPLNQDEQEMLSHGEMAARLLNNADFQELQRINEVQSQIRVELLLQSSSTRPAGSPSDEWLKGAVFGILLPLNTLKRMLTDSNELRERMEAEGEEDVREEL